MNEFEVIIELGAEGGSLALHGIRTEQGWLFSRHLVDWTPELINEGRIQGKSTCVDSWDAALCLLDQYPWYKLSPIVIHPTLRTESGSPCSNDCTMTVRFQNQS